MNVIDGMSSEERYAMMRRRHAFLTESVKGYSSLEEYAKDKDEWFAILSVELNAGEKVISLWFQLGYYDYEEYFIVPSVDGQLTVSHIIAWQDFCCANGYLNIFTEESVDSEEFFNKN
ncbi:MAG: hypothetical protein K2H17_09525 [Duncaniella sp.]|uniref:hypothetical protein n=1 Tax=Duncaniella sp. TaxID=2518496 RepID=UPI0023BF4744|nr:hypothetical protein [Duncaniella sp.]MDE5989625.1 hypothetical protein [Duncaniella sp.]